METIRAIVTGSDGKLNAITQSIITQSEQIAAFQAEMNVKLSLMLQKLSDLQQQLLQLQESVG